jgi:hypothetical protein
MEDRMKNRFNDQLGTCTWGGTKIQIFKQDKDERICLQQVNPHRKCNSFLEKLIVNS